MLSGASSPFQVTALYHCHLLPFQLLLHLVPNSSFAGSYPSVYPFLSSLISPLPGEFDLCSSSSLMPSSQSLPYLVAVYFIKSQAE
ncbi:hypothetical protein BDB01DRAFT_389673 [Pilobolus umbonatus]|nr:hypothetical protein BDB01DRAFT_389673 [Pilobolus umbonatus]